MTELKLKVEDMSCGHCVAAIRGEVEKVQGVSGLEADLDTKLVKVTSEGGMETDAVMDAVRSAGYTPALAG